MGKSTITKAVLNEEAIVSRFNARLFVTYDGVVSSSMTFQIFLDRIAEGLQLPPSSSTASVIQHLQTFQVLLVVDNAETILDAPQIDSTHIHKFLEDIGSHPTTRIVMTTRNTETIPLNLPWHRIYVTGLDAKAAHDAFNAVYPIKSGPLNGRYESLNLTCTCLNDQSHGHDKVTYGRM